MPVGLGGTPVNLLARALIDRGHHVTLLTCSPAVTELNWWRSDAMDVGIVPWRARARDRALTGFATEIRYLRKAALESRVDVLHAHWTYEYALAALGTQTPTVVTIHDAPWAVLRHHRDAYRVIRLLMALRVRLRSPRLTAVSPYVGNQWQRSMGGSGRITVVPNIAHGYTGEPVGRVTGRILTVGNSDPLKNVADALKAFQLARRSAPELTMRLVGPGLEADGALARSISASRGVAGIEFLGSLTHDALMTEMASAQLLLHPSLEEAQCMVLNEALASGLTIIAGEESGGVPWSLANGAAGMLVDVTSPIDMADAILHLTRAPQARQALRMEGLKLAADRYSASAVASAYITVYEEILGLQH
ncbi:glycosyltransferase family 4 protein [Nocardioides aestuarii]|uniref:Glycosyltransferase family 4 protein n=1 Tax=Nocardioides aestuarii TaxID=252231 RepID=A0ABW4TJ60_9ACTN